MKAIKLINVTDENELEKLSDVKYIKDEQGKLKEIVLEYGSLQYYLTELVIQPLPEIS